MSFCFVNYCLLLQYEGAIRAIRKSAQTPRLREGVGAHLKMHGMQSGRRRRADRNGQLLYFYNNKLKF